MSFTKLWSDLQADHKQLLDARLHQYAGTKPDSLEGEIYENASIDTPMFVANGGIHIPILAASSAAPPDLVIGQAAEVGTATRGLRADAKFGLPSLVTPSVDGFARAVDKAKIDASTSVPTPSVLAMYDSNSRLNAADAVAGTQVVNWQTMQAQIALSAAGLAEKDPCRGIFFSLPANTYNAGTKRLTASANGALPSTPDGVGSWQPNDRVFFCGTIGTGSAQAGPYRIIQVGTAGLPWILERTVDFGGPGAPVGQRLVGALIQITEGTATGYADSFWTCTNDSITLDTTVLVFRKQTASDVDGVTIQNNAAGKIEVKDAGLVPGKLSDFPATSVLGRSANSTGVSAPIAAASDDVALVRTGASLGFGKISNAILATMPARSVKVNATNATAAPTDLVPGAGDRILQSNATNTALEWGQLRSPGIADDAVPNTKLANMATGTIKGRVTATTGDPEDLTAAQAWSIIAAGKSFVANVGDGVASTLVIPHGLGTKDIIYRIVQNSNDESVGIRSIVDATNITIYAGVVVPSNALRVLAWRV